MVSTRESQKRKASPDGKKVPKKKAERKNHAGSNDDDDAMSVDTATAANGGTATHKFSSYCSLRLEVPKSKQGTNTMRTRLSIAFKILQDADSNLSFVSYKSDATLDDDGSIITSTSELIRIPDDIPSSITAIGKFFFGARPSDKGGMIFAQIHLLHNEPIDNIIEDTKTEFHEKRIFLSLQPIQHWDVSNIGFLKNLYWDVDIAALTEFLHLHLKRLHRKTIMVGLKVKTPYDGRKKGTGDNKTPFRDRIQAVHVSVQGEFEDAAIKHLKTILKSEVFKRRYAVDVRLIPSFNWKDSPHTQDKIKRCIVSHGQFCRSVDSMACMGIDHLDQRNTKLKQTIRELIVGLPDAHFLSIDLNWRGDSYNILFPKKYDEIARNHIAHLGSYLHKAYGDDILPSLPAVTQETIANTTWTKDGTPQSVIDVELDAILEADNKVEYIDLTALYEPETTRPSIPVVSDKFIPVLDDQTISTFGQSFTKPMVTPQKGMSEDDVQAEDKSTISAVTMDSRVSKIESQFNTLESLLQQIWNREFQTGSTKPPEEKSPTAGLDVDIVGGAESRTQWDLLPYTHSLPKLLSLREGSRCCSGHNVHEKFTIKQQGGTFIASTPIMSANVLDVGNDPEGLGRWCWLRLAGKTVVTRVVVAYQPCRTRKIATSATIAQQRRYWRVKGNKTCPRRLFRQHLLAQLETWRDQGEKLILLIDANENMQTGPLSQALKGGNLQMQDAVQHRTNIPGPPTYIRGVRQIDAIWTTPDLVIKNGCFLPFNFALGDHRGVMIDISKVSLLGESRHVIPRSFSRRLQCSKPETKRRYLAILETYCRRHCVLQKIYKLYSTPASPSLVQLKLDSIDKVLGDGMHHAEKKCRHIFAGEVPFSLEVANAGLLIKLWSLVIRYRLGKNVNSRRIRRVAKKCSIVGALRTSLEEAKVNKSNAWISYKKYKKQARRLRDAFLQNKVDAALTIKEKNQLKAIIRHEEARQSWGAINKSRGKRRNNAISAVQIQTNGEWILVEDCDKVEQAIMANNSKRFHLAATTPLMSSYATNKIGFLGNTSYSASIIDGSFTADAGLDTYTNQFFQLIGSTPTLPSIDIAVSMADFQKYWRSCRERTSSSMSGRHFGHYKAAATNDFLSEIHSSIAHLAIQSRAHLTRWTRGLSVMLEKIDGVIKVDKLRAILLMEADFNFLNKLIFGHRMIQQCEEKGRFPQELFGSRGNMSADEVALNRRLVIDGMRVMRRNGAIAGVDAAQCYDRIVHSLSSILCQNEGVPIPPIIVMYGVIQSMHYFLRTAFGDSSKSYGGKQQIPFQGSCQGNGASPAIWLVISMYLVLLMHQQGHTSTLHSAYSGICLTFIGFLFVDDTDLVIFGNNNETAAVVHDRLQRAINFWNGILRVTGGALKPEKCYWYSISFTWKDGVSTISTTSPPPIYLENDVGVRQAIAYKPPNTATEAVGVWQAIDDTDNKQLQILINKIRQAQTTLEQAPLPRHLLWMGLKQAIWPSIAYVLPSISLSQSESHILAKELYRPILSRLGCNRNYPLLLRYNPSYLLGLNLFDPYLEQGISKLKMLMMHGSSKSMTGKLIQQLLEQHQLEVGFFVCFLSLSHSKYSFLTTTSWLTEIWEFISTHNITLSCSEQITPTPQRTGDKALMDIWCNELKLPQSTLASLNRVRCYLQLFSLADVVTGDGKAIQYPCLHGITDESTSAWQWHTQRPTIKDFRIWKSYIATILEYNGTSKHKVGHWLIRPHRSWHWFIHSITNNLYHCTDNGWHLFFRRSNSTRTSMIYEHVRPVATPPDDLHMVTVRVITEDIVQLDGISPTNYNNLPLLSSKWTPTCWLSRHCHNPQDITTKWFADGLYDGTLRAICDGSYKPKLTTQGCTAAYIIEDSHQQFQIHGKVALAHMHTDAYRGELAGILSIISAVQFAERHNPYYKGGSLRIGCDNEKAGFLSGQKDKRVSSSQNHMDILKAIRRTQQNLRTQITLYHLYGHQDEHRSFSSLPRDVQLNVLVDNIAQQHIDVVHSQDTFITNEIFPQEGWYIVLGGCKIVDNHAFHLKDWIGKQRLQQYLFNKGLIAWNVFPKIDFKSIQLYLAHQTQSFCLWYSKHWSGFCGIGSKMKVMGLWADDLCPCCRQIPERSPTHLFHCPYPSMSTLRNTLFHNILEWMEEVNTCPNIQHLIRCFWTNITPQFDSTSPLSLRTIYNTMQDLGVQSMWQGFIPIGLTHLQHNYYLLSGNRKTGEWWGQTLVGKLLRATHKLWLHRNHLLHIKTDNGLNGMDMIQLREMVTKQLETGRQGMLQEDWYLMDVNLHDLMADSVESIRGWLCNVLIARGEIAAAQEESLKDRQHTNVASSQVTAQQRNKFMNWRNICLK